MAPISSGGVAFGVGLLMAFLFLIALGLVMLLGRVTALWTTLIVLLAGIPLVLYPSRLGIIASIVLALGLMSDRAHARSALLKNTSENWFVPIKTCFGSMLTGLALVIAIIVLTSSTLPSPSITQLIPTSGVRYALTHIGSVSGDAKIDPAMTVREYIVSQAEADGVPLSRLAPAEQNRIILTSIAQFEAKFNVQITPNETLESAVHRSTVSFLEKYSGPYVRFFPYVSAIGLFFSLRFLFIPLRLIVVACIMGIVKLLLKWGVVKQGARQITIYYPELV